MLMRKANHAYLSAGSALLDFIAGRLGAPGCWPNDNYSRSFVTRAPDETPRSIQRWENEGGKTIVPATFYRSRALHHFHAPQP